MGPAPIRLFGEVVGGDVLDEITELVDDLLGLLLLLGNGGYLTDLVDQFIGGEQRSVASHGEGNGVGGTGRDDDRRLIPPNEVELGEVRVLTHLGDHDAIQAGLEGLECPHEQIVGQRAGWFDPFEAVVDGRRLDRPDVDGEQALLAALLAQQDHRRVRRDLHPDANEFEWHHAFDCTGPPASGQRSSSQCGAGPWHPDRGRRRTSYMHTPSTGAPAADRSDSTSVDSSPPGAFPASAASGDGRDSGVALVLGHHSDGSTVRPGLLFSLANGLVIGGLALGVAQLVAGFNSLWRSPILDVGDRVIDAAPPFVKEFAVETFGSNDKPALLIGMGAILAVFAAVMVGWLGMRMSRWIGIGALVAFGVVGVWASLSRRQGAPLSAAVPTIIGVGVALTAFVVVHHLVTTPQANAGGATNEVGRRGFLSVAGGAVGAMAVSGGMAAAIGRLLSNRYSAGASRDDVSLPVPSGDRVTIPEGADLGVQGISPFVTPNDTFYRVDTAITVPQVQAASYTLTVKGMIDNEITLSYDELLDREMIERDVTLTCVSNTVGGPYVGNAVWLGTRLDTLLEEAGIKSGADQIVGRSVDGYTCGFPVETLNDGRDAIVAVGMNGEPLPLEHGFPARLVVPGLYGYVSATKWLKEIELTTFDAFDHYWRRRGWAQKAPIKLMSRIDTPQGLANVTAGRVAIGGVAWAQTIGISAVEVQIDDGEWQEAMLGKVPSVDTWVQWTLPWDATAGRHQIVVRAVDKEGTIQTADRAEPIPDGASGRQSIIVIVK